MNCAGQTRLSIENCHNVQWPETLTFLSVSVCFCKKKKWRSKYCFVAKHFSHIFQPFSNKKWSNWFTTACLYYYLGLGLSYTFTNHSYTWTFRLKKCEMVAFHFFCHDFCVHSNTKRLNNNIIIWYLRRVFSFVWASAKFQSSELFHTIKCLSFVFKSVKVYHFFIMHTKKAYDCVSIANFIELMPKRIWLSYF